MIRSLDSFDIRGQRVLIRLDLNVPILNGTIKDDFRIRESIPTIKYCLGEGASIVIMSHLGRPQGQLDSNLSLIPIGEHIASLLELPIKFSDDCISQDAIDTSLSLKSGEIHLLENLRFNLGEINNDSDFANRLSRHGRIYINDAFGTAHREHASNNSIVNNFKHYGIGLLINKELRYQKDLMTKPEAPLVLVLGGAKIKTKIELIEKYIQKADRIIIGGGMAFTFIKAMGLNIGKSIIETRMIAKAKEIIDFARMSGKEIILPTDVICAANINSEPINTPFNIRDIPNDLAGFDIGPDSVQNFKLHLESAKTIIWNGPMGVFEKQSFLNGTKELGIYLSRLCENKSIVIAGGGDTSSAIKILDLLDKITHVSTGGGASLELLSGRKLKALEKLEV